MECKATSIFFIKFLSSDLIDTLWNVKLYQEGMVLGTSGDLIDTLWNVKELLGYNRINVSRFNRYIVECKAESLTSSLNRATSI